MIAYLSINSLREKIINLREILKKTKIDVLSINETRLDSSFPNHQFKIEGYQFPPPKRDRNSKGGGKMVFVRGFIVKETKNFETKNTETICLELTIVKRKWCILFAYRPTNTDNKEIFDEISVSVNKILGKYDNIILAGDLNIDELRPCSDSSKNHLFDMKDIFGLTKFIKEPTCFKSQNSTLLDLILTNTPRSFMQSQNFEV